MTINILDIIRGTTVDGPGFRTSIYMAGCRHACPGCHNPGSWDFGAGTPMTVDELVAIVAEEDFDVTLSGGDPLYHPEETAALARAIVERTGHNVWLYTGFTYEQILASPRLSLPLPWLDTIVDGPFRQDMHDPDLKFRGSANQRIIRLKMN